MGPQPHIQEYLSPPPLPPAPPPVIWSQNTRSQHHPSNPRLHLSKRRLFNLQPSKSPAADGKTHEKNLPAPKTLTLNPTRTEKDSDELCAVKGYRGGEERGANPYCSTNGQTQPPTFWVTITFNYHDQLWFVHRACAWAFVAAATSRATKHSMSIQKHVKHFQKCCHQHINTLEPHDCSMRK